MCNPVQPAFAECLLGALYYVGGCQDYRAGRCSPFAQDAYNLVGKTDRTTERRSVKDGVGGMPRGSRASLVGSQRSH